MKIIELVEDRNHDVLVDVVVPVNEDEASHVLASMIRLGNPKGLRVMMHNVGTAPKCVSCHFWEPIKGEVLCRFCGGGMVV